MINETTNLRGFRSVKQTKQVYSGFGSVDLHYCFSNLDKRTDNEYSGFGGVDQKRSRQFRVRKRSRMLCAKGYVYMDPSVNPQPASITSKTHHVYYDFEVVDQTQAALALGLSL